MWPQQTAIRNTLLALALALECLSSCSATPGGSAASTSEPAPQTATITSDANVRAEAARTRAAVLFEGRSEGSAVRAAIAAWSIAAAADPTDWRSCQMLARAFLWLGQAHMAKETAALRADAFERGQQWALRGLERQSSAFAKLLSQKVPIEDAVAVLGPSAAPLVYWYVTNLGSGARERGRLDALRQKNRILTLITFVFDNAPRLYFRGADRFLGAFYAAVPAALGGDVAKSERHFRAAIEGGAQYPANYLLMAEYYATRIGDRALFRRLVAAVLDAKPCTDDGVTPCIAPGWEAESEAEIRRAGELAAREASLF